MRKISFLVIAGSIILVSCSDNQPTEVTERITTTDVAMSGTDMAMPPPPPAPPAPNGAPAPVPPPSSQVSPSSGEFSSRDISGAVGSRSEMPVSAPKIAYIYDYGFRISAAEIAPLQQKHADMCEAMGPTSCQILSLSQTGSEGDYAGGELRLAVASPRARDFGAKLSAEAEGRGGDQVSASIQGEDLSKAIVDTEARLRARTVLRDRLMEVLETRRGTVAELVEAERGVAQVNEEIDQARSWLSEMKTRVAFSRVNIAYRSGTPETGGFFDPIRSAFGSIGSILGVMVAALIVLLAIGLPIAAIIVAILWGRRRYTSDQDEPIEAEVMPKSDSSA